MLFVFHMDTATVITFDIKLALQNVAQLKEAIERECGVLVQHQVLLMSGGESLESDARVCSYSTGTDTNPIYLFSKAAIESYLPPSPSVDYGSEVDLQGQIENSLTMPATYHTLVVRAQLAQQCVTLAREQTRICERVVHDQHLQQQGWAAVVANLEDITQNFESRVELLQQTFQYYLSERQRNMELLANFNADLKMLEKIPILTGLRAQAEGILNADDQTISELDSESMKNPLTLLQWISAKDNHSSLSQVAEHCSKGLEQFDENVMEALKSEVTLALVSATKADMKEIKGLGERLFALGQLMVQMKQLVQDQGELAQGFLQNQNRANNLGDASVLPDLCMSHRRQLMVMMQNHNQMRDIKRRCMRAKEELSSNIYQRLKWIMYVENKMVEVDSKLVMYHESLRRLRRHLEVLQQIHMAPQMYMSAVAEVVRRRTFSQAFLVWASNLACQLLTVHSEEIERRREFQSKFEGHFLNSLFPGLEDLPPSFATQAPSVFDTGLPKLTVDDMETLRSQLPELELNISTIELNSITQFFLSKSLTDTSSVDPKDKETSLLPIDDGTSKEDKEQTRAPMSTDKGGFESETDTEEFEKISQGVTDSKLVSFEGVKQKQQKQMEVGATRSVSPASSCSANISPQSSKMSSSSTTNEQPVQFQIQALPSSERSAQLSPLDERAEQGDFGFYHRRNSVKHSDEIPIPSAKNAQHNSSEQMSSLSPNPMTQPVTCDGQQRQHSGSGGSSPLIGVGTSDFMCTEFYMDESLPSSLSEHPNDSQHQAIVSLLQENLGNTRDEVERLRSIIKNMKSVMSEVLSIIRQELVTLKGNAASDRSNMDEIAAAVKRALTMYSQICDQRIKEREQELTVDHELELDDMKKLMEDREEEMQTMKCSLFETESKLAEHEKLVSTMCKQMKIEKTEIRELESKLLEMSVSDNKAQINQLEESLRESQKRIQELEAELAASVTNQQRAVKEAVDKVQLDYKSEMETLRVRYKLMAASSSMERSPSDSSLEKIERPDVIELANHEAILAEVRESMTLAQNQAVELAVIEERNKCMSELRDDLMNARELMEKREFDVTEKERYIIEKEQELKEKEGSILEMCETYKERCEEMEKEKRMAMLDHEEIVTNMKEEMARDRTEAIRQAIFRERAECLAKFEAEFTMAKQIVTDKDREMREFVEKIRQGSYNKTCERCKTDLRNTAHGSTGTQQSFDEAVKISESNNLSNTVTECSRIESIEDTERRDTSQCVVTRLQEAFGASLVLESDDAEASESKKVRLDATDEIVIGGLTVRLDFLERDNARLSSELLSIRESKDVAESKVKALEASELKLKNKLIKATSLLAQNKRRDTTKEMAASVAIISDSGSKDAAANPEQNFRSTSMGCLQPASSSSHSRKKLQKTTSKIVPNKYITTASCNPGDIVLVLWDSHYRNYTINQDCTTLYFLNSDCLGLLGLGVNLDGSPKCLHSKAVVVDKEYCHARKAENRYNVPQGTKFYRVRVRPLEEVDPESVDS